MQDLLFDEAVFVGIAFVGLLAASPCIQLYDCVCWPSIPFRPIPYTAIRTSHFVLVRPFLWVLFFVELRTVTPRIRVFRLSLSPSIPCSPIPYTPSMHPISSWSSRFIRFALCGGAYRDSSYPSVLIELIAILPGLSQSICTMHA